MIDQHKLTRQQDSPREQEFTRRYAQLLAWALRLTNNHRATAEDLVQDAFIQFTRARTNLDDIENLDGYLHRMLRNMHISRVGRTAQQAQTNSLSISELECHFDSRGIELQDRLQAHEELCRICQYACIRKESSRAGSVLILRFFHDYTPSEIAEVLCTSRHCVDQWQGFARRELKLYLTTPQRLKFVTTAKSITVSQMRAFSGRSLPDDLRVLIFSSRQGACLPTEELKQIYEAKIGELLSTTKLGHIVSCRSCLDQVNSILGLPNLDQRYQATNSNSQLPPMAGGGCGGGSDEGPTGLNSKLRRHLADVINHEPKELHIALNGLRMGSLKVGADNSELNLNLFADDPAEFLEIVSEEGVQLLFFNLNHDEYDADGQWAQMELSDGRVLETRFYIEGESPTLRVTYRHTVPARKAVALTAVRTRETLRPDLSESRLTTAQTTEPISSIGRFSAPNLLVKLGALLIGSRRLFRSRSYLNPQVVTLLIASVLIAGLILIWTRPDASVLLNRAVTAEEYSNRSYGLLHRVMRLEQRRAGEDSASVQTIKIWQDTGDGRIARRVYDERNNLIAGEWRTPNTPPVIYHHQLGFKSLPEPNKDYATALMEPWLIDVTAKAFRTMVGTSNLEVAETPREYIISWNGSRRVGATTLLSASVTITKQDLVVVQETLEVEKTDGRYQYRIVELESERLNDQQSLPEYFRPDASLSEARTSENSARVATRNKSLDRAKPVGSTASTELEIEVTYLLNRAKADKNEQIALTRTGGGSLLIEGVVETDQRKKEIEAVLAPVRKNPLVNVQLQTASDVSRRVRPSPNRITEALTNTANTIAVDAELRSYLKANSPSSVTNMDAAVQQFSTKVVRASYRALFHAIELKRLSNRFSSSDLRTVGPDARSKWIEMLHENAKAFEVETATIRQSLGPIFFSHAPTTPAANDRRISTDEALAKTAERLWKVALTNNRIVRDAFTISSENSDVVVKSTSFWQSLITSEALAAEILNYDY